MFSTKLKNYVSFKDFFHYKRVLNIFLIYFLFFFSFVFKLDSKTWEFNKINSLEIISNDSDFGGISSLSIENNGKNLIMLSDKGFFFKGIIDRNSDNKMTNLTLTSKEKLLKSNGKIVDGKNIDSEGLAKSINGNFFISFESNHRIMYHEKLDLPGKLLIKHPDFSKFEVNKGIETLAINSKNHLFAIPELPSKIKRGFPIYILKNKKWSADNLIEVSDNFQITDGTFINDNLLIILERDLDWVKGFRTQIRIIEFLEGRINKIHKVFTSDYTSTNFEGISIWKENDEFKKLKIILISDNNFLPFIETKISEYELIMTEK